MHDRLEVIERQRFVDAVQISLVPFGVARFVDRPERPERQRSRARRQPLTRVRRPDETAQPDVRGRLCPRGP